MELARLGAPQPAALTTVTATAMQPATTRAERHERRPRVRAGGISGGRGSRRAASPRTLLRPHTRTASLWLLCRGRGVVEDDGSLPGGRPGSCERVTIPAGALGLPMFSVGQATTPRLSFVDALDAYERAGADGIGIIDCADLWREPTAFARFRASDLEAGFCILSTTSVLPLTDVGRPYAGHDEPDRRVAEICASIRRLAKYQPKFCLCSPGPQGAYGEAQAREIVVEGFRCVARSAADVGVTIAFEPFHRSLKELFSFGNSIAEAASLLDDVAEPNTGILFDIWHMWDYPDVHAEIRTHAARILGVHVDDWRNPTRSWCDRVLPGDGVADVVGILRALREGGFSGWYELEVLSDDGTFGNDFADSLSKRDPVELIREGRDKFIEAWLVAGGSGAACA